MEKRDRMIWVWIAALGMGFLGTIDSAAGQAVPRDFPSQRWLPDGDFSNTRSLLERIQKRSELPSRDKALSQLQLSPEEMRKHAESLLRGLPPEERQRLKSMAQKLQREGGNRRALEDELPFSQELLESLKESRELMQLIEELQTDLPSINPEDSPEGDDGINPFAPRPSPSDRAKTETKKSNSGVAPKQSELQPNPSKSPGTTPSGRTDLPPKPSAQATTKDGSSKFPPAASDSPTTDTLGNRDTTKSSFDADSMPSNPGVRTESMSSVNRPTRTIENGPSTSPSRSRPPEEQRKRDTRSTRDPNRSPPNESSPSTIRSKSESALAIFQRKLDELGLGRMLETLAKEAIGMEQRSSAPLSAPSPANTTANTTASRAATRKFEFDDSTQPPRSTPQVQRTNQPPFERPIPTQSSRSAGTESSAANSSTFPSLALPEFPSIDRRLLLACVLLIVALIAVYFYLLESKKLISRHRQDSSSWNNSKNDGTWGDATNRKEYIFLFHRMMGRMFPRAEEWWTHRTVITESCAKHPQLAEEMFLASEVYEKARYMPEELELHPVEIAGACKAIQKCLSVHRSTT